MKPLECRAARQRVRFRIRECLDRQGLNAAEVARRLGLRQTQVSETIAGNRNDLRVLLALRDEFGVPEHLLYIPERGKQAA
jgi:transcriptional regulator with XRE-family HTH domain